MSGIESGVGRVESAGYREETVLHRTIRGGADFHLAREMEEMQEMKRDNKRMRRNKIRRSKPRKSRAKVRE